MSPSILVVEDDAAIAAQYADLLAEDGLVVECVADGLRGLERAAQRAWSMVLLDVGLPGMNGMDLVRELRYRRMTAPVLIVSGRDREIDRVLGVELGADAYVTKPIGFAELRARVRALLRRTSQDARGATGPAEGRLVLGPLQVDVAGRRVWKDGAELQLTAREFDLLAHFAASPGRVHTPRQLLQAVWHTDFAGYEGNVKTFVNRLRARIEADPARPCLILTVRGTGYRSVGAGD